MNDFGINLAVGALKAVAFIYDVCTLPVYFLIQRPWETLALSKRQKAKIVAEDADSITWRSLDKTQGTHIELIREKIDTMASMLEYVSKKYSKKRCLGTRLIKGEEDEVQPNGRVFKKYNLGDYVWQSYDEVNHMAEDFGKGIRELGNVPRENVVIFAETRAEWLIAAHGLFKQSIPVVTIYATLGDEAIAHGINETEVTTVITSYDLMPKFKNILSLMPNVKTLIYMEDQLKQLDTNEYDLERVKIWKFSEVLRLGEDSNVGNTMPVPSDIAIIMYTSGSTGVPKGVILDHSNLIAAVKAFFDNTNLQSDDCLIAYLPLAHVFEQLVESVGMCAGASIGYSGALTLLDISTKLKRGIKGDATLLKPTCMASVPLVLDRISKGIKEKVGKGSTLTKVLFKFAYEYKMSWVRKGYSTPIIDRLVFNKVAQLTGGHLKLIFSGGAPLSPDTHEQIELCLCLRLIQGYGLTETTSCATVMDVYDKTFGIVGHPTTANDIKIMNWEEGNYRVTDKPYPRGEIVIGGSNISRGYYKLPDKTEEDFEFADGRQWFKTGDIGQVHEDGVVKIIDRKKDLVKLQAGEYVSLGKVEAEMKTCSVVDNICVYAESSKQYCVALIVPNQNRLNQLAITNGITGKSLIELCNMPEMEKIVVKEIAEHGKTSKLEKFEIPATVTLCKEVWSPDLGLVTAAFKLKRKEIQHRYKNEINKMYK